MRAELDAEILAAQRKRKATAPWWTATSPAASIFEDVGTCRSTCAGSASSSESDHGASDNNIGPASASMTMIQALRSAMDVMLERDNNVVVFGQDVGYFGGVFRCTEGLQTKYGSSRVFDTPISEGSIVGVAVGMGAYGLRPVCEIQFADYFYPASDQIVSRRRACATARSTSSSRR